MNYYPHHIGDYLKDTAHLTMIEDGAYRRLIDLYYLHEQPLPAEKRQVYRLARAASTAERKAIDTILAEYFSPGPDGWTHRRCDAEIDRSREKSDKARRSAAKRWDSEGNANASTDAMRTHSEGNAYPITNNQEPKEKKEGDHTRDAGAYGTIAKTLRLKSVDVQPGNPDFRAWVDAGLTEDEALAGLEIARTSKPAPERMPWGYLSKVLATQRKTASAVPSKAERPPTANERRAAWSADLKNVIEQATAQPRREVDMGVIDATGTRD